MTTRREQIKKFVGNKIFNVLFIKKSTGELREFNAKLGVTKHLKGTGKPRLPNDNILTFFVMSDNQADSKLQYRSLDVNNILKIKCNNTVIEF